LTATAAIAADTPPALVQPPLCSVFETTPSASGTETCRIEPTAGEADRRDVKLSLKATTEPVRVGGYHLETDNYNRSYLPPVVEARPGDTLWVHLSNALTGGGGHSGTMHGSGATPPTNLHTHGLIVSPNNAAETAKGDGDNIFVRIDPGSTFDYRIRVPTELPASVLDGDHGTTIEHPTGLYWYHSHFHGISAGQVAGGMSGLMSIGARDVNVVAQDPAKTDELRQRTDVAYMMLRDLQISSDVEPALANGESPATWQREFDAKWCGELPAPDAKGRDGYCLDPSNKAKVWLFTVNGQRFPTVTIAGARNHLWRVANLSASVTYRLDIVPEGAQGDDPLPFDILNVDGVVPSAPVAGADTGAAAPPPVKAIRQTSLLLMPAGRADIYVRNDASEAAPERRYVLRTQGCDTGLTPIQPGEKACEAQASTGQGDKWPEIRLARVVLGATGGTTDVVVAGLNAPVFKATAAPATAAAASAVLADEPRLPDGCIPDIDRTKREHRRITFAIISGGSGGNPERLGLSSVNVFPPQPTGTHKITTFRKVDGTELLKLDFEKYLDESGNVVWDPAAHGGNGTDKPKHICIQIAKSGHHQLWELHNPTGELHNFHLHQVKFRLATDKELEEFGIAPEPPQQPSLGEPAVAGGAGESVWHDTLPVANSKRIYIIVNFDAAEQIGRYVFHCHILEHEDAGMMAPIEVLP
jgi:FtsP/CotA-like multicopper oxidase with cupredoxin domain